jgi:hypothetical protein
LCRPAPGSSSGRHGGSSSVSRPATSSELLKNFIAAIALAAAIGVHAEEPMIVWGPGGISILVTELCIVKGEPGNGSVAHAGARVGCSYNEDGNYRIVWTGGEVQKLTKKEMKLDETYIKSRACDSKNIKIRDEYGNIYHARTEEYYECVRTKDVIFIK